MEQFGNLNSEKDVSSYSNLNYEEIYKNHKGFMARKMVHYFYIYDQLFSAYRKKNKPLTIMEIGVDKGGSIEMWKKYFPEGSKIHGIDINPECKEINFTENIYFHLGSASDRNFMEKTFKDIEFDIILDDGSHICSDVIATFEIMFPKLKNGGLYVVEDLHTSYWPHYGGGRKKGTSIEYFKSFVETLNADHIRPSSVFLNKFANYLKGDFRDRMKRIWKKHVNKKHFMGMDYPKLIESITFYDSVCAIKKFSAPKNSPFRVVVPDDENYGEISCFKNELEYVQSVKDIFGVE